MALRLKTGPILKGALTFIPGMARLLPETCGIAPSAGYSYGVWLKHLVMLDASGKLEPPQTVVELGPGTSLGTGFAALLSGAERYVALDAVAHSDTASNLRVFDEMVELFRRRTARPAKGWPDYDHHLDDRLFPSHILTDEVLARSLAPSRIAKLREAVAAAAPDADYPPRSIVTYLAPWQNREVEKPASADLVITHTVLSHVDGVERVYRAMYGWLRSGGLMSHQIDFCYPGFDGQWNGYWACPEPLWKIIRGKRPFGINRLPCSAHLNLMTQHGFEIVCKLVQRDTSGRPRSQLASRWRQLSEDDLQAASLFVIARKPEGPDYRSDRDFLPENADEPAWTAQVAQPAGASS